MSYGYLPNGDKDALSVGETDSLFRLLTEEIKDVTEGDKLKGWTPWVIAASIASGAWIVFQDAWAHRLSLHASQASFLATTCAIVSIRSLLGILDNSARVSADSRRFHLLHARWNPRSALVSLIWDVFVTVAIFTFHTPKTSLDRWLGSLFFVFAVFSAFSLTVALTRIPLPVPRKVNTVSALLALLVNVLVGYAGFQLFRSPEFVASTIFDVRAGVVAALSCYAFQILAQGTGADDGTRASLQELRRKLMLDMMSVEDARHEARTVLEGMWLPDLAREDMRLLQAQIFRVRSLYATAFEKIETLKTGIPLSDPGQRTLAKFEKDALANSFSALEDIAARVTQVANSYLALLSKVRKRILIVGRLLGERAIDERAILADVFRGQAQADEDRQRFLLEYYAMEQAWNVWFPHELRDRNPFEPKSQARLG